MEDISVFGIAIIVLIIFTIILVSRAVRTIPARTGPSSGLAATPACLPLA
jgi:hypothetical protein